MALVRRIGLGVTLSVNAVVIGSIVDGFAGPDCKADEVDTTILSETFKTFAKSQIDPGQLTFVIAYDPNYTDTTSLNTLLASGASATWLVTYPTATLTETFSGYVSGLSREIKKDGLCQATLTIKISGDPGLP